MVGNDANQIPMLGRPPAQKRHACQMALIVPIGMCDTRVIVYGTSILLPCSIQSRRDQLTTIAGGGHLACQGELGVLALDENAPAVSMRPSLKR
jgi:hypothetical protein